MCISMKKKSVSKMLSKKQKFYRTPKENKTIHKSRIFLWMTFNYDLFIGLLITK